MTKIFQFIKKVVGGYRPKFSNDATEKMKTLILQCLNQDARERPSFEEIFRKLSSDFTFIDEDVDEEEINSFLELLPSYDRVINDSYNEKPNQDKSTDFDEKLKQKLLCNERKCYFDIFKSLINQQVDLKNIFINKIYFILMEQYYIQHANQVISNLSNISFH